MKGKGQCIYSSKWAFSEMRRLNGIYKLCDQMQWNNHVCKIKLA